MAERDDDSDVPEEFTAEEGIKQDEEIRRIQRESKTRVAREGKEQRRRWEERKTKRSPRVKGSVEGPEREMHEEGQVKEGMLPIDIVNLLAAREKKTFQSDSEDEAVNDNKPVPNKKKRKTPGEGLVLLREIPAAECLHSSMEFLKKRKGQVLRSTSVLKNPNQALRLLSTTGVLRQR